MWSNFQNLLIMQPGPQQSTEVVDENPPIALTLEQVNKYMMEGGTYSIARGFAIAEELKKMMTLGTFVFELPTLQDKTGRFLPIDDYENEFAFHFALQQCIYACLTQEEVSLTDVKLRRTGSARMQATITLA